MIEYYQFCDDADDYFYIYDYLVWSSAITSSRKYFDRINFLSFKIEIKNWLLLLKIDIRKHNDMSF